MKLGESGKRLTSEGFSDRIRSLVAIGKAVDITRLEYIRLWNFELALERSKVAEIAFQTAAGMDRLLA